MLAIPDILQAVPPILTSWNGMQSRELVHAINRTPPEFQFLALQFCQRTGRKVQFFLELLEEGRYDLIHRTVPFPEA